MQEENAETIAAIARERRPLKYDLSTEVIKHADGDISVGNTGLRFTIAERDGEKVLIQDFEPEGSIGPPINPADSTKRTLIYAGALNQFIKYYGQHKDELPSKVTNSTNPTMSKVRQKLLGDYYESSTFTSENGKEYEKYSFDLDKVSDDSDLMQKMQKMNERMDKQNYKMRTEVQKEKDVLVITVDDIKKNTL